MTVAGTVCAVASAEKVVQGVPMEEANVDELISQIPPGVSLAVGDLAELGVADGILALPAPGGGPSSAAAASGSEGIIGSRQRSASPITSLAKDVADGFAQFSMAQLREGCRQHGVSSRGRMDAMVKRLTEFIIAQARGRAVSVGCQGY